MDQQQNKQEFGVKVLGFSAPEELAQAAAGDWVRDLGESSRPVYVTALLGGRIAARFFAQAARCLRNSPAGAKLDRVHFFWSDERCVPPADPESNFLPAKELLLQPLRIPEQNIHRSRGEEPHPQAVAQVTGELLKLDVPMAGGIPVLDLVFLGLGEDGHIASLFPGEAESALADPSLFRVVSSPKPPPFRITMGYPVLASARQVWVLASGAGKAGALQESLRPNGRTPLARLLRLRGRTETRLYTDVPQD